MPFEIVPPGTNIDFIGKRQICGIISLLVILAGAGAAMTRGVSLGIDFAGGTEVAVRFDPGTGSILLQIIIGGVAGLGVVAKLYWHRLRSLVGLDKKEPQEEPPSAVK